MVAVDQLAHASEDTLMGGESEVLGSETGSGLAVGVVVEEDSAEDGALSVERGGKPAFEFEVGSGGHDLQRV